MSKALSERDLIQYKQELKQKYPGSVGKVKGSGRAVPRDAIFLQKAYDNDVIIYDSGVAIYRTDFISQPNVTKYANMKAAVEAAFEQGYKPTGGFQSGWFNDRKLAISEAKKQYQEDTSVFQPVESKKLTEVRKEREEMPFSQPMYQQPEFNQISQRPQMIQRQPNFFGGADPNKAALEIIKDSDNFKPYKFQTKTKNLAGFANELKAADSAIRGAGAAILRERTTPTPKMTKAQFNALKKKSKGGK